MFDDDVCYRALSARDARFNGLFFVGVKTTGIYCRSICRARTPSRSRCIFYSTNQAAERDGFRACFLCKPELKISHMGNDPISNLVEQFITKTQDDDFDASLSDLARDLGVTERHVRRAVETQLGISPLEFIQWKKIRTAQTLLCDRTRSITDIALMSGFSSLRRFNAAFRVLCSKTPSAFRKEGAFQLQRHSLTLKLQYHPPLAWDAMLKFLGTRAIDSCESVHDNRYSRTLRIGKYQGWCSVACPPNSTFLLLEVSLSMMPVLMTVIHRIRRCFDLDAQPTIIANHLSKDRILKPLVEAQPGLRIPGNYDGFELAVRAILGQQISVSAATKQATRLATFVGPAIDTCDPALNTLFPTPDEILTMKEQDRVQIGIPSSKMRAIQSLAHACLQNKISFELGVDATTTMNALREIPGIGDWTAEYIAMRALSWPDAYPASDLGLRNALGKISASQSRDYAESLRPWRAYAAMYLWNNLS